MEDLAETVSIKLSDGQFAQFLIRMPPYAKRKPDFASWDEDVLVAEKHGVVYGAVSVSSRNTSCVAGQWRKSFEKRLENLTCTVNGGWISKLYVFPEYRNHGIGTMLIEAAAKRLRERAFSEVYAGIYVKNEFRKVSEDIFRKNGFKEVGSCICPLPDGHCRGLLLKKTIGSTKQQ